MMHLPHPVHPIHPIHPIVLAMEAPEFLTEDLVTNRAMRQGASFCCPISATSHKPSRCHAKDATDRVDPGLVTIRIHISDHLIGGQWSSAAKKPDAVRRRHTGARPRINFAAAHPFAQRPSPHIHSRSNDLDCSPLCFMDFSGLRDQALSSVPGVFWIFSWHSYILQQISELNPGRFKWGHAAGDSLGLDLIIAPS